MTEIFVFGSNLNGWHGAGSAYAAKKNHGAIQGQGVGLQGNSYAIPTKGYDMEPIWLEHIETHVKEFIKFAHDHPEMKFTIVAIGCGLAGFTPTQIAPMFKDVPNNCKLPPEFKQ